jgi:hypothetical protein
LSPKLERWNTVETDLSDSGSSCAEKVTEAFLPLAGPDKGVFLRKIEVPHENHVHHKWEVATPESFNRSNRDTKISEDEEGCPCCIAGLDFDEFAAAIKELTRSKEAEGALAGIADFNDPTHWWIFLGVAAPLGLVGLSAAIRNLKGSGDTFWHLDKVIKTLSDYIQKHEKCGNIEDAKKLKAFKNCLIYSKQDARFNWWVPGLINGTASSLVLSTAVTKHPFALPVLGLYAVCQLGRNLFDAFRVRKHGIKPKLGDIQPVISGKKKVNQIARSRMSFYLTNSLGFAAFAAGALLTFLSVPAMGLFGAGAVAMPVGLALLSFGAASTGIMNNIWPRKFKPRNGDLGIHRLQLMSTDNALEEIAWRRERKKVLQEAFGAFKADGHLRKKWLKFLTAMPESKDYLPSKFARRVTDLRKRFLPFLPDTGTAASTNKHTLNVSLAMKNHMSTDASRTVQQSRLGALQKMANLPISRAEKLTSEQLFKNTWSLLRHLKLDSEVATIWLNEHFGTREVDAKGGVSSSSDCDTGCCGDHEHGAQDGHAHAHAHAHVHVHDNNDVHKHHHAHEEGQGNLSSHNHSHSHLNADVHGSCADHNCHDHDHGDTTGDERGNQLAPGLFSQTPSLATFDADEFWAQSNETDRLRFQAAIDYTLFYVYPKRMTYEIYGLYDYLQQMRRTLL